MAGEAGTAGSKPAPPRRSWSAANSRQFIKAYDKSPVTSPPLSRTNSTSSVKSTQSEPAWKASGHEPRKGSESSTQSSASRKKRLKSWFFGDEEKERKALDKQVLTSRHAAAVKTKMMMDPAYREFQEKHKRPNVKTAGMNGSRSVHSLAAEQESRYPHSGPPAVHGGLNASQLERIESRDDPDDEDQWQQTRREWNEAKEHNMDNIPEMRSRLNSARASPWASPIQSREPSPNRTSGTRTPRATYAGRYHRNLEGRWTKKDTPPVIHRHNGGISHPDFSASSLAERLSALSY
ncbi:hypothetical protein H2198_003609 [Neophaeococcomyces mojaviensis]|uniref:Uncharacterized protein n=1 Tax=Neophaeococcomyces mojaviensis TaxID=3383035 RepID=A0ACC3AB26_9EURO|nr:hypothetical protein H2198_003609 [Knufia sp. JES_112]